MLALTLPTLASAEGSDPSEPSGEALPLGFPTELWAEMSEEHRSACTSADALLGAFGTKRTASLRSVGRRAGLEIGEALAGLRVLDGMNLVEIEAGDRGPIVTLLAMPEDHVRVIGPDGAVRWVFVARPLDAPEVAAEDLN
jgi:hypothetical protein